MSTPHPLERLVADGAADYRSCIPRDQNPFGSDPARAKWFAQWDRAAHEGARILKANAAQRLYRACLTGAVLLRDMAAHPRTLTTRSLRFSETLTEFDLALSCALASSGTQQSLSGVPVSHSQETSP